jgi:hypothetical protein
VALLVSSPQVWPGYNPALTFTTQIAPTILHALGLNPGQLEAVHTEGTKVLSR